MTYTATVTFRGNPNSFLKIYTNIEERWWGKNYVDLTDTNKTVYTIPLFNVIDLVWKEDKK